MLPGKRLIAATVVTASAVLVFILFRGEKEPSYNGLSVTEWGVEWDKAQKRKQTFRQEEANEAFRQIGTNGIPWALEQISEPFSHKLYELSRWPILNWLSLSSSREYPKKMAAHLFYISGSDAAPWVPQLVEILSKAEAYDVRERVTLCLASIGDEAAPQLAEILENPRNPAWTHTVIHLLGPRPFSDPARMFVIPASNERMYSQQRLDFAVESVGRISREHRNEVLRVAAVSALAQLGETLYIESAMTDPALGVRVAATNAWQRAKTNTVKILPYPR